ncbi:MAG: long-chain-fatty-acid--CoA ligase [Pseudomonadota bacterium]
MTDIATLADLSRQQAQAHGAATAMVFGDRATTFAELDDIASRCANGLAAAGVGRQARVGYLGKNSDRFFQIALGCAKAAQVITGINFRLAAPEIEYIATDAAIEALFVGEDFFGDAEQLEKQISSLKLIVTVSGDHPRWPSFERWLEAQDASEPDTGVRPDDDFEQLYTSGTTGHPKGVQLTHGGWCQFADAMQSASWASYDTGEVVLGAMPVFHVAGSNTGLLALLQGCKLVVVDDIVPSHLLDTLERHGINHAFLVPAVIMMLLAVPDVGQRDFSKLRIMSYGAAPIAEAVLEQAQATFQCGFVQLYGLTENFGGATFLPPEDHEPARGKLRSCGKAYANSEVRIVDGDGNTLPSGEVGEICLRSGWLMRGYWRNPDATAEAIRDGWFHTGDAGFLDDEGYLFIHDRIKDMIISGGENIYPAEVENALFAHPDVADVAVIGVPDERWGEAVKAVVVAAPGSEPDEADLIKWSRSRIAAYKTPRSVDFVAELPRNASGKVLRRELRKKHWRGRSRNVS